MDRFINFRTYIQRISNDIRNTRFLSITKKAVEFGFKIDIIVIYVDKEEVANLFDVKVNKEFIDR